MCESKIFFMRLVLLNHTLYKRIFPILVKTCYHLELMKIKFKSLDIGRQLFKQMNAVYGNMLICQIVLECI